MADIDSAHVNIIALTGDLTNMGLPGECRHALRWLEQLPAPCTVIPGNHDTLVHDNWHQTIGLWQPWMERAPLPFVRRVGPVALIGVSSAVPTPWFRATGRMGARQAARLTEILHETGRQGLCRIVMIHHAPVQGFAIARKALKDPIISPVALHAKGRRWYPRAYPHLHPVFPARPWWLRAGHWRLIGIGAVA